MTKKDLIKFILDFSKHRKIFHSESDFQLELGMYFMRNNFEVRLEKSFKKISIYNKIELDIELNGCIAIELKYKTDVFKGTVNNEIFELKQHGANSLGRFDVFNDARRVKSLKDSNKTTINKGYTVFLTNDKNYWSNDGSKTMSKDFDLTNHRNLKKGEILDWNPKTPKIKSVSKKRLSPFSPIKIEFDDVINWYDFSEIGNCENGDFRFFILDIN